MRKPVRSVPRDARKPVCPACFGLLVHQRRYPKKLCPEHLRERAREIEEKRR